MTRLIPAVLLALAVAIDAHCSDDDGLDAAVRDLVAANARHPLFWTRPMLYELVRGRK